MSDLSIAESLRQATQRLTATSPTAQLDAQLLLTEVLDVSTAYFYTWPDKVLSNDQQVAFDALLVRREQGEPIAYILGQQDFWTLTLATSPSTLIPRADTERLVEVALEKLEGMSAPKVLDLGTGTGAIALAIAQEVPEADVLGIDYSAEAVALARRNAESNVISNARFKQSDWFAQLGAQERFDIIVSNPPYIDPDDVHLEQGDVRFEPLSALVAQEQGLADIRHIISQASDYLNHSGWLLFEHGYDQAQAVQALLLAANFSAVETFQDLGDNDRVTIGRKE
ncbi:peptide chain release factor N(5)-glutamine methyltransferase [Marinomonas ostreistagni]|uniref:peptide chain release factor N(5)-glutamine methyltransferase n=1 Tax=Marinomonas ostreistagni TaxID=359209 RepID=UPI0030840421